MRTEDRQYNIHGAMAPQAPCCLLSSHFNCLLKEERSHSIAKQSSDGAPTVCMHAVSGSVSLPSRGSFRLSLTVLVHYRSITSI